MKNFNIGSERGFTLIEMLVVIIIISFLVGIVLTGTLGFQASARDTRRIGDLRNAQNFLELYFNKCGYYPGGSGNSSPGCTWTVGSWDSLADLMKTANITSQFPKEVTAGGKKYYYGLGESGLSYTIGAELERDNSVLKDDIDGTTNTTPPLNCGTATDDKIYCISSS